MPHPARSMHLCTAIEVNAATRIDWQYGMSFRAYGVRKILQEIDVTLVERGPYTIADCPCRSNWAGGTMQLGSLPL